MERRSEPRIPTNEVVMLTVLDNKDATPMAGRMVDLSGRGMRISLPGPVTVSAPVKVQSSTCLYVGEVAFCQKFEGVWYAGVQACQRFSDTDDLADLRRALAGRPVSETAPSPLVSARS
jgi:hypothetical protein